MTDGRVADDGGPSGIEVVRKRTEEVRGNIRDTAKWVIISFASILTIVIGGTGFSQLGALDWGARLAFAASCLLIGILACLKLLGQVIDLMWIRARSLSAITTSAQYEKARGQVEREMLCQKDPPYDKFETLWAGYNSSKRDDFIFSLNEAVELCSTKETEIRFNTFLQALKIFGSTAVISFALFAWAANPAKDMECEKIRAKPFLEKIAWSAQDEAVLTRAGLSGECQKLGHPTLVIVSDLSGMRAGVIAIPKSMGPECPPVRVGLTNENRLISVD